MVRGTIMSIRLMWGRKNWESENDDDYELAESILNVGENLVDWGKQFLYNN